MIVQSLKDQVSGAVAGAAGLPATRPPSGYGPPYGAVRPPGAAWRGLSRRGQLWRCPVDAVPRVLTLRVCYGYTRTPILAFIQLSKSVSVRPPTGRFSLPPTICPPMHTRPITTSYRFRLALSSTPPASPRGVAISYSSGRKNVWYRSRNITPFVGTREGRDGRTVHRHRRKPPDGVGDRRWESRSGTERLSPQR